jgi:hypothetical protein
LSDEPADHVQFPLRRKTRWFNHNVITQSQQLRTPLSQDGPVDGDDDSPVVEDVVHNESLRKDVQPKDKSAHGFGG